MPPEPLMQVPTQPLIFHLAPYRLQLLKPNNWQPSEEQTGPLLENRAFKEANLGFAHPPHLKRLPQPPTLTSSPGTVL